MTSHHDPTPAVVMGLTVTGLAVARALGRRGIEVVAVHSGSGPATARSRHLRPVRSPGNDDSAKLLEFYLDLARSLGRRAVLLPTGDRNVRFIAEHRAALAESYAFRICDPALLEVISSKRALVGVAERHGLPLPPTILPESREDLSRKLDRLRFPCVVKPEFTHLWQSPLARRAGIGGLKALPIESAAELLRRYDELARVDPRIVVQQMVVGPDSNHYSYQALIDAEGGYVAEFAAQKFRLAPPHYGMGSLVRSIAADEIREPARHVLDALGYLGMGGVQFKRDSRDGALYLIEMGVRFNVFTGLAVACGVDLPYLCYKDVLGERVDAPQRYSVGTWWLNPWDDFRSMRAYARDGSWTWAGWLGSVLRLPVNAYFAWDDPAPALALGFRLLRSGLGRRLGGRPPDDDA